MLSLCTVALPRVVADLFSWFSRELLAAFWPCAHFLSPSSPHIPLLLFTFIRLPHALSWLLTGTCAPPPVYCRPLCSPFLFPLRVFSFRLTFSVLPLPLALCLHFSCLLPRASPAPLVYPRPFPPISRFCPFALPGFADLLTGWYAAGGLAGRSGSCPLILPSNQRPPCPSP